MHELQAQLIYSHRLILAHKLAALQRQPVETRKSARVSGEGKGFIKTMSSEGPPNDVASIATLSSFLALEEQIENRRLGCIAQVDYSNVRHEINVCSVAEAVVFNVKGATLFGAKSEDNCTRDFRRLVNDACTDTAMPMTNMGEIDQAGLQENAWSDDDSDDDIYALGGRMEDYKDEAYSENSFMLDVLGLGPPASSATALGDTQRSGAVCANRSSISPLDSLCGVDIELRLHKANEQRSELFKRDQVSCSYVW